MADQPWNCSDQLRRKLPVRLKADNFFRISRQFIISIKAIRKINQLFNGQLKVDLAPALNEGVLISREKSSRFKKWLDQSSFLKNGHAAYSKKD